MNRTDIIKCLKKLGFKGPINKKGGDHPEFMERGSLKLKLPNPHKGKDVHDPLLSELRKQAGLTKEECKSA